MSELLYLGVLYIHLIIINFSYCMGRVQTLYIILLIRHLSALDLPLIVRPFILSIILTRYTSAIKERAPKRRMH